MKAFTDLEQSKKLAKILPLESADMYYIKYSSSDNPNWEFNEDFPPMILGNVHINEITAETLPCWSLAALLNILPYPSLLKTFSGWRCDSYNKEGNTCMLGESADNQIDACYEMILKLNELKLL